MAINTLTHDPNSLNRRVRYFDAFLNAKQWKSCFLRLDPKLRDGKVDYEAYAKSLSTFYATYGPISIESVNLQLYSNAKSKLYENRSFACGQIRWQDKKGRAHIFQERWVKVDDKWYTRKVGLV